MNNIVLIIPVGLFIILIGILWGNGITTMMEKYPEYDGSDFLNEDIEIRLKKDSLLK